jgi:hypothetical protein
VAVRVVLRAARPEEAARIHELHTASVRALCSAHYSVEILDAWLEHRTAEAYVPRIASGALFVAERDGRIVGRFGSKRRSMLVTSTSAQGSVK